MEIVQLLIKRGASIDSIGLYGEAPIHMAAAEDRVDIAQLLIENGADVNAKTSENWTPLHVAAIFGKSFYFFFLCLEVDKIEFVNYFLNFNL